MSIPTSAPTRRYITKRGVATRYNVTPRTVDRWKKAKILPPADRTVNGRQYWNEGGLDEHDRQLVAELAATANETGRKLRGKQPGREIMRQSNAA